jgi:lipopolysaccharide transport system ATP-binding protein
MSVVIRIEDVWKQYRLGVINNKYLFRDVQSWWARFRGKEDPNTMVGMAAGGNGARNPGERVWALKGVSLDVHEGEVLGIIGRNGAGKSTLLKIISKVTAPTKGYVKIKGRVGSLLEVGTGFNPELTGRENVFINGAILGMTHAEIKRKFDEIVDFSGVEKYIDTPVKRYSSGMHVRLAFAVAAHLDPEILIVDEVLAVGDFRFQEKCLGKMEETRRSGRTVCFVSHNMSAIANLCTRVVVVHDGCLIASGAIDNAIQAYLGTCRNHERTVPLGDRVDRTGSGYFRFLEVVLTSADGKPVNCFRCGEQKVSVHILGRSLHTTPLEGVVTVRIRNTLGTRISALWTELKGISISVTGYCVITFTIHKISLVPGTYHCDIYFGRWGGNEPFDLVSDAFAFRVEPGDFFGTGAVVPATFDDKFLLDYDLEWKQLRNLGDVQVWWNIAPPRMSNGANVVL